MSSVAPALSSQPAIRVERRTRFFVVMSGVILALVLIGFARAMLLRRRSQAHKHLMLLASLAVLGPALARIARWPGFGGEQGPFVTLVSLALLLAIVAHDLYSTRRLHPAGAALVLITIASMVIGGSELGRSILPGIK